MSIYQLKSKFQNLLRPLVRILYKRGITANQVTLAACGVSIFLGVLLCAVHSYSSWFYLLPIWFFLRMALNAIDGMLAREFGQKSALGGYLNELTDVVADAILYLPFAFIAPFYGFQIGLVIYVATLTEMVGVLGQVHGNSRRYDGPVGKSDRAFLFGGLGLWYAVAGTLPSWLSWGMWLVVGLLILTCWHRLQAGLAEER